MRTKNADNFLDANTKSPVVSAAVIGRGGEGAVYTLRDGQVFKLTAAECASIVPPRWDVEPN